MTLHLFFNLFTYFDLPGLFLDNHHTMQCYIDIILDFPFILI